MSFTFTKLNIPEVILIETNYFSDDRGFFMERYKESIFIENGITAKFVQTNFSHSIKNTLRGMHYQKNPTAQAKLVGVISGKIFDVAVDIRKNSPTYGKWIGEILSDTNHRLLFIPEGFAHGFCVLSDIANVIYQVNQEYSPNDDRGVLWSDPEINIHWPIEKPLISDKDSIQPLLKNTENNFDC